MEELRYLVIQIDQHRPPTRDRGSLTVSACDGYYSHEDAAQSVADLFHAEHPGSVVHVVRILSTLEHYDG